MTRGRTLITHPRWIIILTLIVNTYGAPTCVLCPPGEGAVSCTECVPCADGFFSSRYSALPCEPCTRCDVDTFTRDSCSRVTDVTCENCDVAFVLGIEEYMQQCQTHSNNIIKRMKSSQQDGGSFWNGEGNVVLGVHQSNRDDNLSNVNEALNVILTKSRHKRHVEDIQDNNDEGSGDKIDDMNDENSDGNSEFKSDDNNDDKSDESSDDESMVDLLKDEEFIPDKSRGTTTHDHHSTSHPKAGPVVADLDLDELVMGSGEEFDLGVVFTDLYDQSSIFEERTSTSSYDITESIAATPDGDSSTIMVHFDVTTEEETFSDYQYDVTITPTEDEQTTFIGETSEIDDVIYTSDVTESVDTTEAESIMTDFAYLTDVVSEMEYGLNYRDKLARVTTTVPSTFEENDFTESIIVAMTVEKLGKPMLESTSKSPTSQIKSESVTSALTSHSSKSTTLSTTSGSTPQVSLGSVSSAKKSNTSVIVSVLVVSGIVCIIIGVVVFFKCRRGKKDKWKPNGNLDKEASEPLDTDKEKELQEISGDQTPSKEDAIETTPLNADTDATSDDAVTSVDPVKVLHENNT